MRLIDADELKKQIDTPDYTLYNAEMRVEHIEQCIEDAPTIEAETVRHGEWSFTGDGWVECSECNETYLTSTVPRNYCPNCGTKMDNETKHGTTANGKCPELAGYTKESQLNERILCAAIKINVDGELIIISGFRHGDCFDVIHKLCSGKHITHDEQGFLTTSGRFVSRKEAKIIAKQADQLIRNSVFSELISEDIY